MKRNNSVTEKVNSKNLVISVGVFLLMGLMISCGSGKESRRAEVGNFEEFREFVNSREFEIENEWAEPLGGGQINLLGNPNHIRFLGDSIKLFLPYFGVRHAGGDYGGRDGGIKFEGIPQELEILEAENNGNIRIKFRAEEDQEDLGFLITIFPNGRTSTSVNSSERSTISYRGYLNKLPEKVKKN